MIDLLAKCPRCGYRLAKIDGLRVATYQVRRTCRSCYSAWRILVRPLPTRHAGAGIAMHELSFVELEVKS